LGDHPEVIKFWYLIVDSHFTWHHEKGQ